MESHRVCEHRLVERVCIPRLHRRSLVGGGERGEHRVAGLNVREVAFHDLRFVTLRRAAEVATHRIDGLESRVAQQLRCAAAIVLGERRPGKVDPGSHVRRTVRAWMQARVRGNVSIAYTPRDRYLESKPLKLYLSSFRNEGVFCEALAVKIRDDVGEALGLEADGVRVRLTQKARGGITITATS